MVITNLTYEALAREIELMTDEQKGQNVTMFLPGMDEFFPCRLSMTGEDCDVLDVNHVILVPDYERSHDHDD